MFLQILIFLISITVLLSSGKILIKSLSKISEGFGLREFTVAFFVMSLATASPELFVGLSSALNNSPELSLGNIIGQNIIHFTLAITICVLLGGSFLIQSETVKRTAWFSALMAFLPILFVYDGYLSRVDGLILLIGFLLFSFWIFGKKERFEKDFFLFTNYNLSPVKRILSLFKEFFYFLLGVSLLLLSSYGIVKTSVFFASNFGVPLVFIGVVIVGLGTSLPEVYFSAVSAFRRKSSLMAGNLLGSTVVSTSLVLGIVSLIQPVKVDLSFYMVNRLFLFLAIALFLIFMSSGKKIDRFEAILLLLVYILFIVFELLTLSGKFVF
jgi:cation:H+ antiporter